VAEAKRAPAKAKAAKQQKGQRGRGTEKLKGRESAKAGGQTLRVKQVRSGIGHAETYRRTLRALGLRYHQQEIVVRDSSTVRGMLHKVRHLVRVTAEA
jgi:large subunit ribosomal protein L30